MVVGSCLCGTVRYETSGPFSSMMNCHCSMCRKHHGSAFVTYVSAPASGFRWLSGEDSVRKYKSSDQGVRTSCTICGSTLPVMAPGSDAVWLLAGPLEGDLDASPEAHIFVGSKAPWYTITDNLPQHEEYPPNMEASGIPRPTVEARPGITAGSCLCGAVAYEATGEPMFMQSCHCQRCRRARAAAHGTNIFYKATEFRWTRGEDSINEYKVPEARFHTIAHCRHCGSGVPKISLERGIAIVPAGGLDTDPVMRPQRHIFTNYKASWFEITDSLPQFTEAPPRAP